MKQIKVSRKFYNNLVKLEKLEDKYTTKIKEEVKQRLEEAKKDIYMTLCVAEEFAPYLKEKSKEIQSHYNFLVDKQIYKNNKHFYK